MDASIFKAYDIRGTVPRSINADVVAYRLGLAFGQRVRAAREDVVAVGRDGRLSSRELAAALARIGQDMLALLERDQPGDSLDCRAA